MCNEVDLVAAVGVAAVVAEPVATLAVATVAEPVAAVAVATSAAAAAAAEDVAGTAVVGPETVRIRMTLTSRMSPCGASNQNAERCLCRLRAENCTHHGNAVESSRWNEGADQNNSHHLTIDLMKEAGCEYTVVVSI